MQPPDSRIAPPQTADFQEFGIFALLSLPSIIARNPPKLANTLGQNFDGDPRLFQKLSELLKVVTGQEKLIQAHFNDDKVIKPKAQYSLQEQTVLYAAFLQNNALKQPLIAHLAQQLNRSQDEIKGWWYNRRSDVAEDKFKIPFAVRQQLDSAAARERAVSQ